MHNNILVIFKTNSITVTVPVQRSQIAHEKYFRTDEIAEIPIQEEVKDGITPTISIQDSETQRIQMMTKRPKVPHFPADGPPISAFPKNCTFLLMMRTVTAMKADIRKRRTLKPKPASFTVKTVPCRSTEWNQCGKTLMHIVTLYTKIYFSQLKCIFIQ